MGHPVLRKDDRLMLIDVAFIKETRDSLSRGPRGGDPVVFAVKTALSSLNPIELKARIAMSYRFPHLSPEMRVLLSLEDMDFSTTFFPDEVSLTISVNPETWLSSSLDRLHSRLIIDELL